MSHHPKLVLALAVTSTLTAYGLTVLITGFAACGLFGCSGGKAVYEPGSAQIGLLACGLVLVPLALLLARHAPLTTRAVTAAGAVVLGAVVAMVVLGLGPHGCPATQSRATVSSTAHDAAAATCSGDADAV